MPIDPREFGRLQAQVETLLAAMDKLTLKIDTLEEKLAHAEGGWKVLLAIGGAAASLGGLISWALTTFTGRGAP